MAAAPEIPARIRRAVDSYEIESERLTGWFQLAGVVLFAALYASTYAAFEVHRAIEPTPIALALYGAFTLWRLRRTYHGLLSRWEQYASAAVDIAVLAGMIWAFPFQYGESAALYLKAPTLLYVHILIALRALRFDPGLVAFTGLMAAAAWTLLALYAAIDGAALTGDYRVYMSSLSLLPGAEFEKVAALVAFSGVLALAVGRARALLYSTATEATAAADLSKFVGRDAAQRIRASSEGVVAGDGEIRRAAIMFIDLRGFTPATKGVAPREVIALLQDYQSRLLPVIEAGGGAVDKFLGDGILVSFGAAKPSERECAQAVETALCVLEEVDLWRADRRRRGLTALDVGVALAAGEVVYGAVGHGDRLEYTVIGDAVNLAAKLEKRAKTAQARIIAAADVLTRAETQGFAFTPLRRLVAAAVDGVDAPLDLAVLG